MASGVMFAELHMLSGEHQESSDLAGIATSPVLSMFKQRRGRLFTVVEPSLPGAGALCRALIETIEDEYFKGSSRAVTTALRQAISAANEKLRSENSKLPPDKQLRVGLSCAAVREGDVYIAQVAPANAFILHGGSVKRVFSTYSVVPDTSGNGTNRASDSLGALLDPHVNLGFSLIQEGDLVVLASGANWKLIPDRYLLESARHLDPEITAKELYNCYTAHARRPTTSLIVIRMAHLPAKLRTNGNGRKAEAGEAPSVTYSTIDAESAQTPVLPRTGNGQVKREKPRVADRETKERKQAGPSLWGKLTSRWRREKPPLYPDGPPLEPVGRPSVRLRENRPIQRGERSQPQPFALAAKLALVLGLAAIFVLLGNLGLNFWRSWQLGDPVALAQEAQQKRTQAAAADNPTAARALLVQAYDLYNRAARAKDEEATKSAAAAVQTDIDRIDQAVSVSQAKVLVDYSTLGDDKADVTQLMLDGSNLYVLDEGLDRIFRYLLNPDGQGVQEPGKHQVLVKRGDKLDGGLIGDLLFLAWMPAGQLRTSPALFALESGRSLVSYDPNVGPNRIEVAESQRWGSIQAVNGFAGGLYLLDTKLKGVFYYPPTKNGYESEPYTILDSRAKVDLSKAVDIALDGNLYVLEGDGSIKRFSREGRPMDFAGNLPDGPIKGPRALYASANTRSLYVLDTTGERVIQFSPEGKLQRQFRADGKNVSFKDLRDLYVDEAGRKLYLLARKSLFTIDLPPMQ